MTVFFTADTHFGDHRVLNISKRPFRSVDEMDAAITERWNRIVSADDEIWHLGDFARTANIATRVFQLLKGRKHLIIGNNDAPAVLSLNWVSVQSYAEMTVDGSPPCALSLSLPDLERHGQRRDQLARS